MTRPCPRCGRANAAHKAKCLYCGVDLPDPAPPPSATAPRELPPDLDALVADALSGRGISRLKAALQSPPAPGPGPAPAPAPVPAPARVAQAPALAAYTPPPDPSILLSRAAAALAAAQDRLAEGDLLAARDAAVALRDLAQAALDALPLPAVAPPPPDPSPSDEPPDPRPALPPVRFEHALFLDGPGDASKASEIAGALGVDVATARLVAASSAARVALRAADPAQLQARVDRLRAVGLHASVIPRGALLELHHPPLLISLRSGEPARILGGGPLWLGDPEDILGARGEPLEELHPVYAVLGEVVTVRTRARAERSRALRQTGGDPTKLDERRVGVIDLWGPGLHLRIVEGLTRVDQPEGRPPFRALLDGLPERFPGIRIEPRRPFQPEVRAGPVAAGTTVASSGWPAFDEHSRLCWLHRRDSFEIE